MRLRSKRQLKELVLYCPQYIRRLENANRFPKRLRLGNGPRSRGGWIESEVLEWLQKRIDDRDKPTDSSVRSEASGLRPGTIPLFQSGSALGDLRTLQSPIRHVLFEEYY